MSDIANNTRSVILNQLLTGNTSVKKKKKQFHSIPKTASGKQVREGIKDALREYYYLLK